MLRTLEHFMKIKKYVNSLSLKLSRRVDDGYGGL